MGGGPVFDQPRLGTQFTAGGLRMPAPGWDPASQALCLASNRDILVGAAGNGMAWLWDLSDCLGWADGSHAGTWVAAEPEAGEHYDETDLARWPRPIGSLAPSANGSPRAWQGYPPISISMLERRLVASFALPRPQDANLESLRGPTFVMAALRPPDRRR